MFVEKYNSNRSKYSGICENTVVIGGKYSFTSWLLRKYRGILDKIIVVFGATTVVFGSTAVAFGCKYSEIGMNTVVFWETTMVFWENTVVLGGKYCEILG